MASPKNPAKPAARKPTSADLGIEKKAGRIKPAITAQRIDETGLTNRVRGHVSAAGKRAQGKKDAR